MGEFLQSHSKKELGLRPIAANMDGEEYVDLALWQTSLFSATPSADQQIAVTIPLFSLEKGDLVMRRIPLPPFKEPSVLPSDHFNEIAIARLMKLKKGGVLQCEVLRMPEPVDGDPPYVPAFLLALNVNKDMILQPVLSKGPRYDPNEMIESFITSLLSLATYPQRILVRTDETAILLKPLCERAHIAFSISKKLEALDEAAEQLWEHQQSDNQLNEIIRMLSVMSLDQLRQLPDVVLKQLVEEDGLLPDQLKDKIRRALQK